MRQGIKIEIYGSVQNSKMLDDLVDAMYFERDAEWKDFVRNSDDDEPVAMVQFLSGVLNNVSPLTIELEDAPYDFDDLRASARASGLGYRVLVGDYGSEYSYAYSFQPGWPSEREGAINGEESPLIDYRDLREAMLEGMEGVEKLVKATEALILPKECALVVSDEVYRIWKAGYDEANDVKFLVYKKGS